MDILHFLVYFKEDFDTLFSHNWENNTITTNKNNISTMEKVILEGYKRNESSVYSELKNPLPPLKFHG